MLRYKELMNINTNMTNNDLIDLNYNHYDHSNSINNNKKFAHEYKILNKDYYNNKQQKLVDNNDYQ